MSEAEIFDSSPRHVCARIKGVAERETRHVRTTWEAARFVAFYAVAPHTKKDAFNKVTDLCEFPWEGDGSKPLKDRPDDLADLKAELEAWTAQLAAEEAANAKNDT